MKQLPSAIVIIVCAVPEGLPLMISLVLMQNTSKMLDHNVLVRKAEGIETAGSLNILFSDKTGTITKGTLEVVDFFTADGNSIPFYELEQHEEVKGCLDLAIGKNTQSMFDASHKVDWWECNRPGIDEIYRGKSFSNTAVQQGLCGYGKSGL